MEGITRYALVFGSRPPTTVGPVRSARSSDIDLLAGLGRPLLAWSGANPTVTGQVHAAASAGLLVDASRGANPPEYWRDDTRQAPHNLFTNLPMLLSHVRWRPTLAAPGHPALRADGHAAAGLGRDAPPG